MQTSYTPDVTDHFCGKLIRQTARALVHDGVFPRSDLDDVMQDLRIALIEQLPLFAPERARWSTFVTQVIKSAALMLRRRQNAECRCPPAEIVSLSKSIPDADGARVDLGDTLSPENCSSVSGGTSSDPSEQLQLTIDVTVVLQTAAPELREIGERLQYQSHAEILKEMGISRSTLGRRIAELRDLFESAGFGG